MSKHTEGEWLISKLATPDWAPEFGIYAYGYQQDLARVSGPNAEANARLIRAAPRMLEKLEAIAEHLEAHPDFKRGNAVVHWCAHAARSAINEAKEIEMKDYFKKPITSLAEAHAFFRKLHEDGMLFHPEDAPITVLKGGGPELLFTREESWEVWERLKEVYNYDKDPCAFCVALVNGET